MQVLPRLFKLWLWVDLDLFYVKVKFGYIGFCMGESENYLYFFLTYCSLRSQSCLKHSAKWVNEVEWVSKVKVILWPWSKVTQISKLNVWLLVCILRWAIQGLLALLFYIVMPLFWLSNCSCSQALAAACGALVEIYRNLLGAQWLNTFLLTQGSNLAGAVNRKPFPWHT